VLREGQSLCGGPQRRSAFSTLASVPRYRIHDHTGDDLGHVEHPAANLEAGDVVVLEDGREALVTTRVETGGGPLEALLQVATTSPPPTDNAADA
jgi:hypothetical protein